MALVHRATLSPSKQELVESWLPTRSWASGQTVAGKLAEYRFDDPAGEVGVETILWRTDRGAITGGVQAQMFFEQDGERVDVPPRIQVVGSGSGDDVADVTSIDSVSDEGMVTVVRAGDLELALARVVGSPLGGAFNLIGRIGDAGEPRVLASLALLSARH